MHNRKILKNISTGVDNQYQIPDELWDRIHVSISPPSPPPRNNKDRPGRAREENRKAMNAIYYAARTGCQWGSLPRSLGAKSTVHDRFKEWRDVEVFQNMWKEGLLEYDQIKGIDWEWQAIDGSLTKAPLGAKKHRTISHRQGKIRSQKNPSC